MELCRLPPLPDGQLVVDRWTEPFWQACAKHRLTVPECLQCGLQRMPPTPFCPGCQGQTLRWVEVSGRGQIYSFTVVRRAIIAGMDTQIPYVPAVVSLQEYPAIRLISAVIDSDIANVGIGSAVTVAWRPGRDGRDLPFFELLL